MIACFGILHDPLPSQADDWNGEYWEPIWPWESNASVGYFLARKYYGDVSSATVDQATGVFQGWELYDILLNLSNHSVTSGTATFEILNATTFVISGTPFATPTPQPTATEAATATPANTPTPQSTPTEIMTPTPQATPTPWYIYGGGIATVTPIGATSVIVNVDEIYTPTPQPTATPQATPTPPNALSTRVAQLEVQPATTTVIYRDLGGGMYGFEEHFDYPHQVWWVPMPDGKRLVSNAYGTSFAYMDDIPVWDTRRVRLTSGGEQTGLYFYLLGMGSGASVYAHGQFMLEDWIPSGGGGGGGVAGARMWTPVEGIMSSMEGSVLTWW